MADAVPNPPTTVKPSWLWTARLVTLFNLLILCGPFVYLAIADSLPWAVAMVLMLPLAIPQLVLLVRLIHPREGGLRQAAGTGAAGVTVAGIVIVLLLVIMFSESHGARDWGLWAVVGAWTAVGGIEWMLFRNARKAQEAQGLALGIWKKWLESATTHFTYYFLFLFLWAVALPGLVRGRTAPNEASSVSSLRTIVTASVTYRDQYQNGFPARLHVLGPPPVGGEENCTTADLIDPILATGRKSGYIFEYRAGPLVEKPVAGCPAGAKSFTLTARPRDYGKTGRRSFFIDQTGVIRFTTEDRAATATDPPLN